MPAVAPQLKKAGRSDGAHDDDLSAGPGDASEAADRRQQVVTVQHVEVRDGGQAIVAGRMKGGGPAKLEGAGARWVRPKQHQPPGFIRSAAG